MPKLKYNRILDKSPDDAPLPGTLTVRLEGNIGEDCPSDMHRYEISVPAEVGVYTVDFSSYAPKHVYELRINDTGEEGASIHFGEKDFASARRQKSSSHQEGISGILRRPALYGR